MRIPVNSCEGCNADAPLKSSGVHAMGNGRYVRCAFLDAELDGYHPALTFLGVYSNDGTLNDSERRQWILNDEGLYRWARSEGVRI